MKTVVAAKGAAQVGEMVQAAVAAKGLGLGMEAAVKATS